MKDIYPCALSEVEQGWRDELAWKEYVESRLGPGKDSEAERVRLEKQLTNPFRIAILLRGSEEERAVQFRDATEEVRKLRNAEVVKIYQDETTDLESQKFRQFFEDVENGEFELIIVEDSYHISGKDEGLSLLIRKFDNLPKPLEIYLFHRKCSVFGLWKPKATDKAGDLSGI